MRLNKLNFIVFDVETTGLDPKSCEIIEIGAVKIIDGEIAGEFSELAKPAKLIPEMITSLTGISNYDVQDSRPPGEVVDSFLDFAEDSALVGQNVDFDISFIKKYLKKRYLSQSIDNIELARIILPYLPSYSLDSLTEYFEIIPDARHRALPDAKATAKIFLMLFELLGSADMEFLDELTKVSRRIDSPLNDFFLAIIREKLEGGIKGVSKIFKKKVSALRLNNIYGDYRGEMFPAAPEVERIRPETAASILEKGGALSLRHENYEERPGQIELAKRIANAFNDCEILISEAGTGIGKSLAYLIPAILWAETTKERVVVSTNTKNLQEQLFLKDIPLLGEIMGFPFRAVLLKGRGNYICINRFSRIKETPERFLSKEERSLLLPVVSWLKDTLSGDLSETGFFPMLAESGFLERINSDSPLCLGAKCPHREECFINRIRKAAQQAHLIIVNHSVVFSDMSADGGVLGSYRRIIFDEAHNVEKSAMRYLGATMTFYSVNRVLNRLYTSFEGARGILAALSGWSEEMKKAYPGYENLSFFISTVSEKVEESRQSAKNLFEKLYSNVVSHDRKNEPMLEGRLRYYENSKYFSSAGDEMSLFKSVLSGLADNLEELANALSPVSENLLKAKESIIIEIQEARVNIMGILEEADFLSEASGPNVFWFEYDNESTYYSLRVKSAPLNVAEILAERLYSRMETVVMTSATMTVAGGDFSYIKNRLGVNLDSRERAVEFIAASPFNYKEQSVVVLPAYLPSPKAEEFIPEVNELIFSLAKELKRGMLVLFTSYSHLQQAYFELRDRFAQNGIILMAQGKDGSRTVILNRFRKDKASVLFGTDSFWEGIDVPGEALEVVVIVKLPFAVPTDPVVQAQMEEVEKNGGDPFMDYSVPEAAIKLRQGAGRLIRRTDDRGAIVILDVRINTAKYGVTFKKSLPGHAQRVESPEKFIEYLKQWFNK